ncbi:hypothetical protein TNCV_95931 [Trichonephila clavipes]|nr:hypothetical protein TNCV_95931 [Trichonephila clavipes]
MDDNSRPHRANPGGFPFEEGNSTNGMASVFSRHESNRAGSEPKIGRGRWCHFLCYVERGRMLYYRRGTQQWLLRNSSSDWIEWVGQGFRTSRLRLKLQC